MGFRAVNHVPARRRFLYAPVDETHHAVGGLVPVSYTHLDVYKRQPKENAEHVMLVDLARNDLSRNCHDVQVEFYKEAHYYSQMCIRDSL